MVTEVKEIEDVVPSRDLSRAYPDPVHLAQFPEFIPSTEKRVPLDFEPIQLPPDSISGSELIINDRGER